MDLQTVTYLVVGASLALYVGIAIWAKAVTARDFYVAGSRITPVQNGMATAADWISAASFISMAGLIAFHGYDASAYLMGWTGGYVLLAILLAPHLRKFGRFTVPEFIGDRYYSQAARLVAVICLIISSTTYVIGQMGGVGVAFSRFLEVDFVTGTLIGMGVVFIYAVLGGMKGITYTQIAQYVVLIFAYSLPPIFISLQLTGNPIPQLGLGGTLSGEEGVYLLDRLDQLLGDLGFSRYTEPRDGSLNMFLLTLSLMLGTAGLPHVIIRFFTVPQVRDARSSAGWALLFIALLYTLAPAVGAMGRLNLIQTLQVGPVGSAEGNLPYAQRPAWFDKWERTGLLRFQDLNGDGRIQYYNQDDPEFAARATDWGWRGNELIKLDADILVFANPEIAGLPYWVIALVAAGGIAAALSTAAGLLLAIASAISHDLLKGVFMKGISERMELRAGRVAMGVVILLAGWLGINPPGFAAEVVALAFGLAAASLFPALLLGIFSKRMNRAGAIAGMLSGLLLTLIYIFWYKGWFFIQGTNLLPNHPDYWWLGIQPESIGAVGALVNFLVAILVSRLTAPPPAAIQRLVEEIRIPKRDYPDSDY